jgi:hypothetical protein
MRTMLRVLKTCLQKEPPQRTKNNRGGTGGYQGPDKALLFPDVLRRSSAYKSCEMCRLACIWAPQLSCSVPVNRVPISPSGRVHRTR